MIIRRYRSGEEQALWSLLYETVHRINAADYSQAQLDVWAPPQCDTAEWQRRLMGTNPFVAEVNGVLVGFAELEASGHINCFYSAHNWQFRGIGSALFETIVNEAAKQGFTRLFVEASITAKDFFLSKGFTLDVEQTVLVRGEWFTNYAMSKQLVD